MKKNNSDVLLALLFGILFLASCSGTKADVLDDPPMSDIEFYDSVIFDGEFSSALRNELPEVSLTFMASPNVNKIPKRLDKWLYMTKKYKGKIVFEPEGGKTKGLLWDAVSSAVVGVYNLVKEKVIYSPSEDYDVTVYYREKDGIITKVVFTRKQPQPTEDF